MRLDAKTSHSRDSLKCCWQAVLTLATVTSLKLKLTNSLVPSRAYFMVLCFGSVLRCCTKMSSFVVIVSFSVYLFSLTFPKNKIVAASSQTNTITSTMKEMKGN